MARYKIQQLICYVHDDITDTCDNYLLDISDKHTLEKKDIRKLRRVMQKIMALTAAAKTKGQSMETRLEKYKETIEKLGFSREKKKKRKER